MNPKFKSRMRRTDTCWLWEGATSGNGYGHFKIEGKEIAAHRYAYEYFKGPIPEGLTIDHLCKVKHCVNPEHLEAVTLRENILRSNSPSALNAKKTHCPQGHEYTEDNTFFYKSGRQCRTCIRGRALS